MIGGPAVTIAGTFNARDVGGHRTADGAVMHTGVLFRSASLDRIGDAGRADLLGLGIQHVVDLRSREETSRAGVFDPAASGIELHLMHSVFGPPTGDPERLRQVLADDDPMAGLYLQMVHEGTSMFADALSLLARVDAPMVVHCTSGKDRTGLLALFVQVLCGVPLDAIVRDYQRSADAVAAVHADMTTRFPEMDVIGAAKLARMAGTDPIWISGVLDSLGGVTGVPEWLATHGVDASAQRAIRNRFLT